MRYPSIGQIFVDTFRNSHDVEERRPTGPRATTARRDTAVRVVLDTYTRHRRAGPNCTRVLQLPFSGSRTSSQMADMMAPRLHRLVRSVPRRCARRATPSGSEHPEHVRPGSDYEGSLPHTYFGAPAAAAPESSFGAAAASARTCGFPRSSRGSALSVLVLVLPAARLPASLAALPRVAGASSVTSGRVPHE